MPTPADALPGRAEPLEIPARHHVNGNPIAPPWPAGIRTAVFGHGCFWGAERRFWETPGVYSTAVGYAGGFTPNSTYREVCTGMTGHAEVVLVAYHPTTVSYEQLLKVFWEAHDPTQGMRQGNDVGTQYRSIIFVGDEAERRAAESSRDAFAARLRRPDHDRDRRRQPLLLRRGLPPAVPGQEPERLLPGPWDGGCLPDRVGRRRHDAVGASSEVDRPTPEPLWAPASSMTFSTSLSSRR